ncbi:hypothetical protein LEP1GSC185_1020 [Leptospira licerasiae serovar Varillal str. VAR 010]|nr:hypothetical protein LEP1GSC185_1020 [Leptospira licerasiae serovar Varillal str. VAR 010]
MEYGRSIRRLLQIVNMIGVIGLMEYRVFEKRYFQMKFFSKICAGFIL